MGMLVLGRRVGKSIILGDGEIKITVLGMEDDGQVRIGIDAPDHVSIHREEIFEKLKRKRV